MADSTRLLFEICLVLAMSYVTAFMEAFTISGYQCYSVSGPYTTQLSSPLLRQLSSPLLRLWLDLVLPYTRCEPPPSPFISASRDSLRTGTWRGLWDLRFTGERSYPWACFLLEFPRRASRTTLDNPAQDLLHSVIPNVLADGRGRQKSAHGLPVHHRQPRFGKPCDSFLPKLLGCCHQDWNAGDLRNRSSDFALFPEKLKSLHPTRAGNGCAVLARLCARCDGSRHDAQLESALQVGPPADLPAVQRDSLLVLMCAGLVDWVCLMTLASRRLLPWLRLNIY